MTGEKPGHTGQERAREVQRVLYCQLRRRVMIGVDAPLTLGDTADILPRGRYEGLPLTCPQKSGVWVIDGLAVTACLKRAAPEEEVCLMGEAYCYVHRTKRQGRDCTKGIRAAVAFLILLCGSALGLCWFHSDVDMPMAQLAVYTLLTGHTPDNPLWITVPYIIGVALGVAVFYALPDRRSTTPLEVKLNAYQADMEKTEGKHPDGQACGYPAGVDCGGRRRRHP